MGDWRDCTVLLVPMIKAIYRERERESKRKRTGVRHTGKTTTLAK